MKIDRFNFREIFLGNLVSQAIKKPSHENPIDTIKDLIDQNVTIVEVEHLFFEKII